MSDEQRISLEDLPAYIEGLLAKEEQLQGQIMLRNSDLEKALATIATLTAENKQLRKTLLDIASYGEAPLGNDGICPYGCDTPHIALKALNQLKETSDE